MADQHFDAEESYDFKPGERERLEREIAEREASLRSAENLAWARARQGEREADRRVVKDFGAPYHRQTAAPAPAPNNSDWRRYIDASVKNGDASTSRAVAKAVGQVLAEVEKARANELAALRTEFKAALELEVMKLRNEFLQDRLDRKRSVKRFEVVPSSEPSSLIA